MNNKVMYYFAPLEGVTGYIYRNAHHTFFSGAEGEMDRYFSPFISTSQNRKLKTREWKDILPENNQGIQLIPQLLGNNAEDFVFYAGEIQKLGYQEINLNLGCPSGTVVAKKKGSGFLAYPEELDDFLYEIYDQSGPDSNLGLKISIKTRIGKNSPEEFEELLEIYNKYPLEELIIHPRVQKDYYSNTPDLNIFKSAFEKSKAPICYNGDLSDREKILKFREEFPSVDRIMIGRGLIKDPSLVIKTVTGKDCLNKEILRKFHDRLFDDYKKEMPGDRPLLFKMKEIWMHMGNLFEDSENIMKKIRKNEKLKNYELLVNELFREHELK